MLFLLAQGSSNNTFPLLGACWGATSRGSQTWQLPEPPRHNCTPPRLKTYCRHLPTPAMACRRGDLFTHSCISKLKFVPFTWPWSLVQTSSLELYPDGGHYFCLIHYYSFQSGPWASWHIDSFFTGRWHIFIPPWQVQKVAARTATMSMLSCWACVVHLWCLLNQLGLIGGKGNCGQWQKLYTGLVLIWSDYWNNRAL